MLGTSESPVESAPAGARRGGTSVSRLLCARRSWACTFARDGSASVGVAGDGSVAASNRAVGWLSPTDVPWTEEACSALWVSWSLVLGRG